MTEKCQSTHKAPKLKVGDEVRITKYKHIFSKVTPITGQEKLLDIIGSVMTTNTWMDNIKDISGETIKESFFKKELLFSKL